MSDYPYLRVTFKGCDNLTGLLRKTNTQIGGGTSRLKKVGVLRRKSRKECKWEKYLASIALSFIWGFIFGVMCVYFVCGIFYILLYGRFVYVVVPLLCLLVTFIIFVGVTPHAVSFCTLDDIPLKKSSSEILIIVGWIVAIVSVGLFVLRTLNVFIT
jgi:hypothetical protein